LRSGQASAAPADPSFGPDHAVAPGHTARVLIGWGDPVLPSAPPFDPSRLNPRNQARWWGTNNDFLALLPYEGDLVLFANHEYCEHVLMWEGPRTNAEHAAIEMAAHGMSVVRIRRTEAGWRVVADPVNRRITAFTPMALSGPAAGHPRLQTSADPEGRRVLGTVHNCSGGVTPWGTVLSCEENIYYYFHGPADRGPDSELRNHQAMGLRKGERWEWWRFDRRFDVAEEPHEPNRFGWVVEVDPLDPSRTPVKRTALGRFCHEGACCVPTDDGRLAVYMGDDARFQHIYRFVTEGIGADALDSGTLSVARFDEDRVHWLPLVHGTGPLIAENGFVDQAGVLIETRRAAELLGATPLDRPERIDVDPETGDVYAVCTNNTRRETTNPASPRAPNDAGHVLRIAGDGHNKPDNAFAIHFLGSDAEGHVLRPDNCVIDPLGRLWLCTDGASYSETQAEGMHLVQGDRIWRLYSAPRGAEVTGPAFTPDGKTLFLSVQHPAEERGSSAQNPTTRWPDFTEGVPPRAAVVVIEREDGGVIGPA